MNNELFGWVWILIGFIGGALMGMKFHREDWLGGYSSHLRRMLRLGHISFFGLGFINILFACSFPRIILPPYLLQTASYALIAGGVLMPLCCFLMAGNRQIYLIFSFPVTALMTGVVLTILGLFR